MNLETKINNYKKKIERVKEFAIREYGSPEELFNAKTLSMELRKNGLQACYNSIIDSAPAYIKEENGGIRRFIFFNMIFPDEWNNFPKDKIKARILKEEKKETLSEEQKQDILIFNHKEELNMHKAILSALNDNPTDSLMDDNTNSLLNMEENAI